MTPVSRTTDSGWVEAGWEPVADAFRNNFIEHGEVGAAFSLYADGHPVVDLWGGIADARTGRPWDRDTLCLVFSCTKGLTSLCAHLLSERGLLDLDAPVAAYWPEFGANGKQDIPVRWLLAHKAGLSYVDRDLTPADLLEPSRVIGDLAAQRPLFEPGTTYAYHALTFGWLAGEVMRRVSGRTVGELFAAEIAQPLNLDCYIGLPPSEEPRVARMEPAAKPADPAMAALMEQFLASAPALVRAVTLGGALPVALIDDDAPLDLNSPQLHKVELPAGNGIATARSLARCYAATVGAIDGVRLLQPETVESARRPQTSGLAWDVGQMPAAAFGTGFMLHSDFKPMLGPSSFGHDGAGGSLAFADVDARIGFAYVMNQMQSSAGRDPRVLSLLDAVRACL